MSCSISNNFLDFPVKTCSWICIASHSLLEGNC
jgi:hypothetical protein